LKGGVDDFSARRSVVKIFAATGKRNQRPGREEGYQDISDSRKQFLSLSAREW
jgi:hypothetical protein